MNTLTIQVLVSAGSSAGTNIGVIYVLLYDPIHDQTVSQFVSGGNGNSYPFSFTDIPVGEYEIIAGTDADNDLIICDAGEACGAWLTIDQPIQIRLERDLAELDFPVEYRVSLPNSSGAEAATGLVERRVGFKRNPDAASSVARRK